MCRQNHDGENKNLSKAPSEGPFNWYEYELGRWLEMGRINILNNLYFLGSPSHVYGKL